MQHREYNINENMNNQDREYTRRTFNAYLEGGGMI